MNNAEDGEKTKKYDSVMTKKRAMTRKELSCVNQITQFSIPCKRGNNNFHIIYFSHKLNSLTESFPCFKFIHIAVVLEFLSYLPVIIFISF